MAKSTSPKVNKRRNRYLRPSSCDDIDTETLVSNAIAGDRQALADLLSHYGPRLRNMVSFRMDQHLQGRVDPSDVLQEAFLELAAKLDEFKTKKTMSFFVWIRLVTMERLLRFHREHLTTQKRDARRELSIDRQLGSDATSMSIALGLLANATSVAGKLARAEQQTALIKLLDEMDAVDREIVALRVFEGLSNDEAAETLDLTKQTASKRFVRAIRRLREAMRMVPALSEHFGNQE